MWTEVLPVTAMAEGPVRGVAKTNFKGVVGNVAQGPGSLAGKAAGVMPLLEEAGRRVLAQGNGTPHRWYVGMQGYVGDAWPQVKDMMGDVWQRVNAGRGGQGQGAVTGTGAGTMVGKQQEVADLSFLDEKGNIKWPENNGFRADSSPKTLVQGELLDRYGEPTGVNAAPHGTPYEARSLPFKKGMKVYHVYRVVKPFDVQAGETMEAFNQPGGGTQYLLPAKITKLLKEGYLEEIPRK